MIGHWDSVSWWYSYLLHLYNTSVKFSVGLIIVFRCSILNSINWLIISIMLSCVILDLEPCYLILSTLPILNWAQSHWLLNTRTISFYSYWDIANNTSVRFQFFICTQALTFTQVTTAIYHNNMLMLCRKA